MTTFRGFRLLAVAALAVAAVGCESPPLEGEALVDESAKAAGKPRVVVAVIDSGINPYHEYFHASDSRSSSPIYPPGSAPTSVTLEVLEEFGIDPSHILRVRRTGDPAADVAADAGVWARIKPNESYWFEGTNIIAVGRNVSGAADSPETGPLILPKDDADSHGVAVVAAALAANPDAIIYFVQHNNDATSGDMGSEQAHRFGFLHPAVDIVSTSYGLVASLPDAKAWTHTFEGVVANGKLHFSAAGNEPSLASHGGGSGPWWSIGITGIYEYDGNHDEQNVRDSATGYFADFVADFEQTLPFCSVCQTGLSSRERGTSLSTPRAAGVASKALLEARRTVGHSGGIRLVDRVPYMVFGPGYGITNWQLRRALEQAAHVPTTTVENYEPLKWPSVGTGVPSVKEAPWLLVGWGELSSLPEKGVVASTLAELGLSSDPQRDKAPGFCDFQTKVIEARHAWWDNVIPATDTAIPDTEAYSGESHGPVAEDPFVYCNNSLPE